MKLLLDADMLAMRCLTMPGLVEEYELAPDQWVRWSGIEKARNRYWEEVDRFCEHFGTERRWVLHCFTEGSTFRKKIDPNYKACRKDKAKPVGFWKFKQDILSINDEPDQLNGQAFMQDMVEADDLLGIFATQLKSWKEQYALISGDKDLKQIPGRRMWLDGQETYNSVADSQRQFWMQVLQGDRVDGVEGCPGYGEKTAAKVVEQLDFDKPLDCWESVVRCFEKKGKSEEYALLQARLVRILQAGEYNFRQKTVSLWNPRTP